MIRIPAPAAAWAKLVCLMAACAAAPASPAKAELLLSQSFESRALGGPMRFSIYLPPGYHATVDDRLRYPVVYLLHGVGDDERAWPNFGHVGGTLDRLIGAGELPPFIVVMPNGARSWWVDSGDIGGPGNYGTAVRDDLTAHVEATWRTETGRDGRFIAGLSMGGFGALRGAFSYPERYRAVGALSAALWNRVAPGWKPADPERMARIFDGSFGSPFDPQRFLANHPRRFLPRIKNPPEAFGVYLAAGDDDGFGTQFATLEMFEDLREADIPVELRIDDGGHDWKVWRRALGPMLQWFASLRPMPGTK